MRRMGKIDSMCNEKNIGKLETRWGEAEVVLLEKNKESILDI